MVVCETGLPSLGPFYLFPGLVFIYSFVTMSPVLPRDGLRFPAPRFLSSWDYRQHWMPSFQAQFFHDFTQNSLGLQ